MRIIRVSAMAAVALTAGMLSTAGAVDVPGKDGNCGAVWTTGTAPATPGATPKKPYFLTCSDGDPLCDDDGIVNNSCSIRLNACVGVVSETCAAPPAVTLPLKLNGPLKKGQLAGFVAPAAAGSCGTQGVITLPLKRVPKNPAKPQRQLKPSKRVTLQMKASGGFVNKLIVQCVPPTGATACPTRTDDPTFPAQLTLTVPDEGSDLDNGWTGSSHNFPIVNGSSLKYCLTGCDGTSDTTCEGVGSTGDGSLNGPTFGAPLPLLAANVAVCVVNRFQANEVAMQYDMSTGIGEGDVNLFSDVYLTGDNTEVCPRCIVSGGGGIDAFGKCSDKARAPGRDCRVNGLATVALGAGNKDYTLSSSCIPSGNSLAATLNIPLPLTTGTRSQTGALPCGDNVGPQTSDDACGGGTCTATCTGLACFTKDSQGRCIDSKGGISQVCCSNNTELPCFPTKNNGTIERTGTPVLPGGRGAFSALFCIARTESSLINTTTGLPGPGALILPADAVITP